MTNTQAQINPLPGSDFDSTVLDSPDDQNTVTVGLVPSPGQAERIVADIAEELPDLLHEHIDGEVTWLIKVIPDPLTGSDIETPDLLDEIDEWRERHGWSFAISVTDIPVRREGQIVIGEASVDRNLGWVSVPPLGVIRLRYRVRSAILQLMNEMRWGSPEGNPSRQAERDQRDPDSAEQRQHTLDPLISSRVAKDVNVPDDEPDVDVRYLAPRVIGHARLLTGMVYANRPWSLFPSFKTTVATAFATGGYVLVFSTVWNLGNVYEVWRLATLTLVSTMILTGWIIISHGLWESNRQSSSRYLTTLYNTTTLLTIGIGVAFAYIAVFVLLLSATAVYIPADVLESEIGQAVEPATYVRIAWMGASVATIAGAVGAGLEDTEAVQDATFSWRQQRRREEYEQIWGSKNEGEQTES